MSRGHWIKSFLIAVVLTGLGAVMVWSYRQGQHERKMEQAQERPLSAASRVSAQGGERLITLDRVAQTNAGITTTTLEPAARQQTLQAYGTVVELRELLDLRNRDAAARAELTKVQAALDASRAAYRRLKNLHDTDRNISDKALQTAEATWRSDEATARAAREAAHAVDVSARQQWGNVLADWLTTDSPDFDRLMALQELLIQVTIPFDASTGPPPKTASIRIAQGTVVPALLISAAPRTDPSIQGKSLWYRIPARASGLVPGMNVVAYLPVGAIMRGVVVPASAVVWWQGSAWVYVQTETGRFARREISTAIPTGEPHPPLRSDSGNQSAAPGVVSSGWFVTTGLSAGDQLVVTGAQLLLSEELRAQLQAGD